MGGGGVSRVWRRRWWPAASRLVDEFWNQAGDTGEGVVVQRVAAALRKLAKYEPVWNPTVLVRLAPADHERLGAGSNEVRARLEDLISARAAHFGTDVGTVRVVIESALPDRREPFVIITGNQPVASPATRVITAHGTRIAGHEGNLGETSWRPRTKESRWMPLLAMRPFDGQCRIPVPRADLVLGRAVPMPGRLPDRKAGRRHCKVRALDRTALWCTDLRSTNGTWVNGIRVVDPVIVQVGQVVRVGLTELLVEPW